MPWGTHFCHFYETKQDLLDTLVPYFKAGLESKEYCLWVVSDSEMLTVEEAKAALAEAVPDFDRHLTDENIEILNGHDWYFENNVLNLEKVMNAWDAKVSQALARGYEGLRASADTFWLAKKDWKDFFAYEKQVNDWITPQTMTVLCTYPLAKSGAAEVLDVVQSHKFAIARRQGEWEVIESPELIQAKAEIRRLYEERQRLKEQTPKQHLTLRYGVSVLSVIATLIITLWLRMEVGQQSTPIVGLFLCAVMFSAWFGGVGPGLLTTALSLLAFVYYFSRPFYSLALEAKEIPRLLIFTLSALFVGSLSAAQRSKAESLRRARDVLDETVQELKRTNVALRAEIAERRRAEAMLHAQEQVFRAIVENAPDQIIRYDRDFRRTYVNPAVAQFYGMPAEALIGKPLGSDIPDAGLAVKEGELAEFHQRIAAVFNTGKSYDYEILWTMPTGSTYFSVHLFPELDLNGSVVNVLGISRDITERKEAEDALRWSEDRIRLIIDTIPVMAWCLGPDGVVDFLNQRWMDYAGLSLEQYVEDPTRPIHPEDIPRFMEKWRANMAAGEPNEDEIRLRRADGKYRWFLIRNAPLRDRQGNVVKWYGASVDIEERKQAEERLRATTKLLRALSARLQSAREEEGTRIAREIHDELGAALTSLKWELESFDKVISECVDQSQSQVLREKIEGMLRLTETTISSVRRISTELRPSILDDLGLVEAIEWEAGQFQARTGIICRCDCSLENLELSQAQSTAVFRIFQEALTNVLRHAQATSVDITMKAEAGCFILTIIDNGRGITEDRKSGNQSLGLLGMQERAHLIGGKINISGVEGKGTMITVRVPISS
jgi:PAS domain S-box-containing protein